MNTQQQKLNTFFYQPFPKWAWLLSPAEWCYSLAGWGRRKAYERGWLREMITENVPVISVGNLTAGGTGKTPIVLAIAKKLVTDGLNVIILTRGYGAEEPLEYQRPLSAKNGDEAFYLQQALPEATVIVGKDRKLNAIWAEKEFEPDVIILDDGFQYIGLRRHLNILLVHGGSQFGNGHQLPLGPLREPLSQISRADMVWITKRTPDNALEDIKSIVRQHNPKQLPIEPVPFSPTSLYRFSDQSTIAPNELEEKEVVLISGIAGPEEFEKSVEKLGYKVLEHHQMDDHQRYSRSLIQELLNGKAPILTTEKDRVKLEDYLTEEQKARFYSLLVEPQLPENLFEHPVFQKLKKPAPEQQVPANV